MPICHSSVAVSAQKSPPAQQSAAENQPVTRVKVEEFIDKRNLMQEPVLGLRKSWRKPLGSCALSIDQWPRVISIRRSPSTFAKNCSTNHCQFLTVDSRCLCSCHFPARAAIDAN